MDGWLIPVSRASKVRNRVCCLTDVLCSCIYLASVVCIFSAAHTHTHTHTHCFKCVCVGVVACSSASHPACMQLVASGYANLGPVNASIQLPYQVTVVV